MKAHQGTAKPFADAPRAVVAIKQTHPNAFHLGIIHRSDEDQVSRMLHLAWHFDLQNEPAEPDYFWVEPGYPSFRARQVATLCRLVAKRHPQGLPYAFSDPDRAINPMTGEVLLGSTRFGFTCASFVLAVFEAAGLPLVVLDSWPTGRDGDAEWQAFIIRLLEQNGASPEHIASVRSEIGRVRHRPTEVAAASSIAPPSATLGDVEPHEKALRILITGQEAV
ncbi:MAG: hypothetical protein NTV08_09630 [Verrucomicrobia bacterium]|nr:hypothetical protein [Verrucomicrobiota bacterium]